MLYIQSALVGIATALIAIVISMITWMVIAANQLHHQFPHAEVGFDLRSMLALPSIIWLIGPLAFTGGFYPLRFAGSANVLPDFLIVRKSPCLEFRKDLFAVNVYFEAASVRWDQNEAGDFAFEFCYEFVGQTDRLRFVVSSLAIDYFDFHTLIFNHATVKQKKLFISRGNSIFVMKSFPSLGG